MSESENLDVRQMVPMMRHSTIFSRWGDLAAGQSFILINDHDPKPLYYQFDAEHHGKFTWDYVESGPSVWRVKIGKV